MKIDANELFQTLSKLKKNGFISLISLIAEDLRQNQTEEERFLLTYTLYNPVNKEFKEIKTTVFEELPSISTLYKSANYDEREIYDLFGIKFKNHPNLTRIFLDKNFEGNPLKNDFELKSPVLPLKHATEEFSVKLEGENIAKYTPNLGFWHKGLEKIAYNKGFSEYLPFAEKVNFLSEFFFSYAYISAVEKLLGVDAPKKSQYIRVLTMELNRISSHLSWIAHFTQNLGLKSPINLIFSLRNDILNIFEKITGGRISHDYYIFGGVKQEISNDILNNICDFINNFDKKFSFFDTFLIKNPIFIDNTKDLGLITSEIALPYSITGVNLRANGLPLDYRKEKPYLIYNELEFTIPTAFEGDCYSRYKLRIEEIKISLNLVKQCTDWLLAHIGEEINLNLNPDKMVNKSTEATSWVESPQGLVICHLKANEHNKIKRLKWRTPSFYTLQLLEKLAPGCTLSSFNTIYNSLDIVLPEADR